VDVRSVSLKRVASAVGEGSIVIRQIHDYLQTRDASEAQVGREVRTHLQRPPFASACRRLGLDIPAEHLVVAAVLGLGYDGSSGSDKWAFAAGPKSA
jgi:hypothetical protein